MSYLCIRRFFKMEWRHTTSQKIKNCDARRNNHGYSLTGWEELWSCERLS